VERVGTENKVIAGTCRRLEEKDEHEKNSKE